MISKKELQYVGGYPNKVPFPGKNYAISVMEYLKKCLDVYKDVYSKKHLVLFSLMVKRLISHC